MPRITDLRFRRGTGTPANGVLNESEPFFDMTAVRPRLFAGDASGNAVLLADPTLVATFDARIALLESKVRLLEQALRDLQFRAWTGMPTFVVPP